MLCRFFTHLLVSGVVLCCVVLNFATAVSQPSTEHFALFSTHQPPTNPFAHLLCFAGGRWFPADFLPFFHFCCSAVTRFTCTCTRTRKCVFYAHKVYMVFSPKMRTKLLDGFYLGGGGCPASLSPPPHTPPPSGELISSTPLSLSPSPTFFFMSACLTLRFSFFFFFFFGFSSFFSQRARSGR